ncbi:hypothetical protein JKP88DRAFT_247486 [Tribonema minus]|uniref:Uncharacterized protein n=1 Tax=Tribonema minus TaxID=303371 RepID=A0A835YPM7_9STRA|nr:hypothetical protein JKP88DRAFT_247486 [Tribonema minus]
MKTAQTPRNPPPAPPLVRPPSPTAAAAVAAAAAFAAAPPITAQQRRAVRQWLHDAFHVSLLAPLSTDAGGGGGGSGGSRGGPAADALRNGCLLCAIACLSSGSGGGSRPDSNRTISERHPDVPFSAARVRWRPLSAADCRHNLALALGHFGAHAAAAAAPPETPFLAPLLHLGGVLVPPLLRGDTDVCWGMLWGLYQGGLRAAERWGLGLGLGANPSLETAYAMDLECHIRYEGGCVPDPDKFCAGVDYHIQGITNVIVIVECDEEGHRNYTLRCELSRMEQIHESIVKANFSTLVASEGEEYALTTPMKPIVFVRYNPDSRKVDGEKERLKRADREAMLLQVLQGISTEMWICLTR